MRKLYLALLLSTAIVGGARAQVNVTSTGGVTLQSYTTLGAAFTAINAGTHTGTVNVMIAGNTNESGPCVLNSGDASPANYASVTIRPTVDAANITGATATGRGLIELNGADNVTIDGDNAGTNGTNRNLTITNTAANTVTYTSVIRLALSSLVTSANNNTIRNCNIIGSGTGRNTSAFTAEVTTWGILASGLASTSAVTTAPGALTSATTTMASGQTVTNLVINNNNIQTVARGVSINGAATTVAAGLLITGNTIGNATLGAADQVCSFGITAQGSADGIISGNVVRVESWQTTNSNIKGIDVGSISGNGTFMIEQNVIERAVNNNTDSWGAFGINVIGGTGTTIRNNFILDCANSQVTGTGAFSTTFGAFGIRLATSTNHKVYHNTVSFTSAIPGATGANLNACIALVSTAVTGCDIRNNIFYNGHTGGNLATGSNSYACIWLPTGATSSMNLTLNNNALYQGTTIVSYIGQLGTTAGSNTYLAANFNAASTTPATNLRAYTSTLSAAGTNDNATVVSTVAPLFMSVSDLRLQNVPGNAALAAGASGTGVTNDIDGSVRAIIPYIGGHEIFTTPVSVQATGGTLSATYASLGAAFTAINAGTHTGAITVQITANTTESAPCVLNSGDASPANYTSVTIRPATNAVSITGATATGRGLIELNGADNVTIDGDNPGSPGINRNLTINNNAANTVTYTSVIRLALSSLVTSANNVTVKNCNITGSGTGRNTSAFTGEVTTWGIVASGGASTSAVTTAPGALSSATTTVASGQTVSNLVITNNNIQTVARGISVNGAATTVAPGNIVSNNIIGNATAGAADQVCSFGITLQGAADGIISGNTVRVESWQTTNSNIRGIDIGGINANGTYTIERNIVERVINNNGGSYGAFGINLQGGTNTIIRNNFVMNCGNSQVAGTAAFSTTFGVHGIRLGSGTGFKVLHNTVSFTNVIPGSTSNDLTSCMTIVGTGVTGCDVRNNIFHNGHTGGNPAAGTNSYTCISLPTGATSSMNLTLNNNALYQGTVATASSIGVVGTTAGSGIYLAANFNPASTSPASNLRAYTSTLSPAGTNDNASFASTTAPLFVSATDLHLQPVGGNLPLMTGATGTGVTNDIDGNTRSATTPFIGAHEVTISGCTGTPTAGTANASVLSGCQTFTTTLTTTGTTTGVSGITYQWQTSPDNIAAYTDITGATTPMYVATVTATAYYRARIGCSTTSTFANTPGIQIVSNPNPPAITGASSPFCAGLSASVSNSMAGGTWISSNGAVATVTPSGSSATVNGVSAGTSNLIYTVAGCSTTSVVTVNPQPSVVTFTPASTAAACLGTGASFTAAATSTYSVPVLTQDWNTSIAPWTIDNTGSSGGSSPANTMWTLRPSGYVAATQTHNSPDNSQFLITVSDAGGSGSVTQTRITSPSFSLAGYSSATLTFQHFYRYITTDVEASVQISTTGGSSWTTLQNYRTGAADVGSSTSFNSATVDLSAYAGQANVMLRFFYSAGWGWSWALDNIRVTASPFPVYTWSGVAGADGLSCTTCATTTITPTSTGTKTYSVTATVGGCSRTGGVTLSVNPLPATITGTMTVCTGRTTVLSNTSGGGTWLAGDASKVSLTASGATVTVNGLAVGTSVITYTLPTGCRTITNVTVNGSPAPITGTLQVCEAGTSALTHPDGGTGTWESVDPSVATVGLTSGVVTGVTSGTATISYTNTNGCVVTRIATVNPLPTVTVTPTSAALCIGNGATFTAVSNAPQMNLLSQDFNTSLGSWSINSDPGVPGANAWQITTPPGATGVAGDGSAYLQANSQGASSSVVTRLTSPSFSTTGGFGSVTLTFNQSLFSFSPDVAASVEYSIGGGPWVELVNQVTGSPTLINDGGGWTSGTPQFTMNLPAAAVGVSDVRLRWVYSAQSLYWVIDNISVKGTMPASSFLWSGPAGLSCTNCASPTITPAVLGANVYNLATTTSAGCVTNTPVTVTTSSPAAISGSSTVCEGAVTTFTNPVTLGTWTSGNSGIASVNSTTGEVTGVLAGNTNITYSSPGGCVAVKPIQVLASPVASGPSSVCQGGTAVFTGSTTGATWSSSAPAIAAITASGVVTASSTLSGSLNILYTLTSSGCATVIPFTVHPKGVISGPASVCEGSSVTLTSSVTGGTWSSANPLVATIDITTGVVTGLNAMNTTMSYTTSEGCVSTRAMQVNALPAPINGASSVCEGSTETLTNATPMGVWSSTVPSVATISTSGEVTPALSSGTTTISYTLLASGCASTLNMTVNPLPDVITGSGTVCAGGGITPLFSSPGGGTWSSANTVIATAGLTSGIVTGNLAGSTTIRYILPTGCMRAHSMVVNPQPNSITGTASVCEGSSTDLNNSTPGGTWISGDGFLASVDALTGLVTGNNDGVVAISYTLSTGCSRVRNVTVNAVPDAMGGALMTCIGKTSLLTSFPTNGVWSSGAASIATVSSSGLVTGVSAGNVNISYTLPTGCRAVGAFTVNPLPATISGNRNVCINNATLLSNATPGGTWAIANPLIASVDMATGTVYGLNQGVTAITYELPTGCTRVATVTVHALPDNIGGPNSTCQGSSVTLTNSTPGGTWSTANASIATITSTSGVLTGVAAGAVNVSYTLPTGCRSTVAVEVNPRPADISGPASVCKDQQVLMSDITPGGSWSVDDPSKAMIDGYGMLTGINAGNVMVKYELPTGCYKTMAVVVNPLPATISGVPTVCQGAVTVLSNATPGGVWSSSNSAVAPISAGGSVLGNTVGFSIISYTLPTGCASNLTMVVNPLPEVVTGATSVCAGSSTVLESNSIGGTWTSSTTAVSVSAAGVVTGVAAGTTTISYTISNGCRRTVLFTVNALPGLITGSSNVCPGLTTTLGNSATGGTWSSDNAGMVSVHPTSGVATATGSDGIANITYTLATGCQRSRAITVYPSVDAVAGATSVCRGLTTTLTNGTVGGTWTTSNASVAAVGASTGIVTGVGAGTAAIAYVMPTGCQSSVVMVVNALPANITGAASVCEGSSVALANAVAGGTWTSSDGSIVSVASTGSATGVATGNATITYTLPTGCMVTRAMVVNALPEVKNITGGGAYCAGGAGVAIGVDGSQSGTLYKLMNGGSAPVLTLVGTGSSLNFGNQTAAGTYMVTAVSTQGCMMDMTGTAAVSVNALVTPSVTVTSNTGDTVCAGTAVTYTATGINGGTTPGYLWKVNGTDVGAGSTYTFVPANGDVVTMKFTSNAACPSPATADAGMRMVVMANLTPSISVTVGPDDSICRGNTAIFTAAAVNGGDAPVYTWVVNGSIIGTATGSTYMYQPANSDVVSVKLNSSYRCPVTNNVSSNTVTMRVDDVFTPVVQLTADPGVIVKEGTEVTFTATPISAGAAPTYQWLINTKVIAGATGPVFKTSDLVNGDSVTCLVQATERCSNLSINSIVMQVTSATGITTGTIANSEIRLMPNPNNGGFAVTGTLSSKVDEEVTYEVTNMLGQVVYRGTAIARNGVVNSRIELDKTLANGMYMLNMSVGTDRKVFNFVLVH